MNILLILIYIVLAIFVIAGWIVCPVLCVRIVKSKGQDPSCWGFFGLVGGVFAVIAAAVLNSKRASPVFIVTREEAEEMEKDPAPAFIDIEDDEQVIVCPACGKKFIVKKCDSEAVCPACGKKLKRKS